MDVSETGKRDIDGLRSLLKEREQQSARELEEVRGGARRQLEQMQKVHEEQVKGIQDKADYNVEKARKNYENELARSTDQFHRTVDEMRNDNYTKFGRLEREYADQRTKDSEMRADQFRTFKGASGKTQDEERLNRDAASAATRQKFEDQKKQMLVDYNQKLKISNDMQDKARSEFAADSRRKLDHLISKTNEDINRNHMQDDLRFRRLAQDSSADLSSQKAAARLRERQLVDEKGNAVAKNQAVAEATMNQYQQRMNDGLTEIVNRNNFQNTLKERTHADQLSRQEQRHQVAQSDREAAFKRAESTIKHNFDVEHDRAAIGKTLDEHRHAQDIYLATEELKNANNLSQDMMRAELSNTLRERDVAEAERFEEIQKQSQKMMAEQQMKTIADRQMLQKNKAADIAEESTRHAKERSSLVREYEKRQHAMDELRKRQLADQQTHYAQELEIKNAEVAKKISAANRDNQEKLYSLQRQIDFKSVEADEQRRLETGAMDAVQRERTKRLADAYNRSVLLQKDSFDNANAELKHENTLKVTKLLGDSDHEKRMQLLNLQSRNRQMMAEFETKLTVMRDEHIAAQDKLKQENEKAMRDTMRKTREMIDSERAAHARELDAKDRLMAEKLRIQEENFKDQIEKIKHTNALALKKS